MKQVFFWLAVVVSLNTTKLWATEPVWFGNENAQRILIINSAMDLASFEPYLLHKNN